MYAVKVSKKPRLSAGFVAADKVLVGPTLAENLGQNTTNDNDTNNADATDKEPPMSLEFTISLALVGWPYHCHTFDNDTQPKVPDALLLRRQRDNPHDENAILVTLAKVAKKTVGYIQKDQAAVLAPLLDNDKIQIQRATVAHVYERSFGITVSGWAYSADALQQLVRYEKKAKQVKVISAKPALRDVQQAAEAPYKLDDLSSLAWSPFDFESAPDSTPTSSWPPSNATLHQFGMAPTSDASWWFETVGLLPPDQWSVTGALDVTSKLSGLSTTQQTYAKHTLNHAIHGVSNVWHPDTLDAATALLYEPNFWCQRSGDAYIRAFGGPYVLGQESEKLVLVRGAPHTPLTRKLCLAHTLVYTLVHLEEPAEPGFNTLIFGCNLRGAGFHYHQDAVSELKAKSSLLLPRQPVVTTILYEKPQQDSGKEVVLWKPMLNWRGSSDLYCAARALQTTHGMMHIQRSGLQSKAQHGVFHSPGNCDQRRGFRVAVTARIAKDDATQRVAAFAAKECYGEEIGPVGDTTMPMAAME